MFKKIFCLTLLFVCLLEASNFRDGAIAFKKGNFSEAKTFLEKAIKDENSIHASYLLGRMYLYGQGVAVDYDKAIELLTEAFDNGNIPAGCYLSETFMLQGSHPSYLAEGFVAGLRHNLPFCRQVFEKYKVYEPQFSTTVL